MAQRATTPELTPPFRSRSFQWAIGVALAVLAFWIGSIGGGIAFLASVLFSVAIFGVAFDNELLRPAVPVCLAMGVGLLPQTLFLLAYNQGFIGPVEPVSLLHFEENYEDTVLKIHEYLDARFKYLPLWVLAFSVLTSLVLSAHWANRLNRWIGTYATWMSRCLLVLLGAATFTLLSPVDSANWTPNLPQRIEALMRIEARAEAREEVAQQLSAQASESITVQSLPSAMTTRIVRSADAGFRIEAWAEAGAEVARRPRARASQSTIMESLASAADTLAANAPTSFEVNSEQRKRIIAENVYYATSRVLADSIDKNDALAHRDTAVVSSPPGEQPPTIQQVRATASETLARYENSERLRQSAIEVLVSTTGSTGHEWADELLRPFAAELVDQLTRSIFVRTYDSAAQRIGGPGLKASIRARCEKLVAAVLHLTIPVSNELMFSTAKSVDKAIEDKRKERFERKFEFK